MGISTETPTLPPHPTLVEHYARSEERAEFVKDLFEKSAPHYEWICRVMSLGSGALYRRRALERSGLRPEARVLDVATGTGLVARAAASVVGERRRVVGLDPCRGMLLQGKKIEPSPLVEATGERLPFGDEMFDFVSHGYALRHLHDIGVGFREFHRVLRPGGRLLILEFTRPSTRAGLALVRFYLGRLVPLLAAARGAEARSLMKYCWDTVQNCVPREKILAALRDSGFRSAGVRIEFGVFAEYVATK